MFDGNVWLCSLCSAVEPGESIYTSLVIYFVSISRTIVFLPNLRLNWGDNDRNRINL